MISFRRTDWQGAMVPPGEEVEPLGTLDIKTLPARSWFKTAHINTSQGSEPSCVGQSFANVVEHLLGDRLPKDKQIDGRQIWREGRYSCYRNLQGGLYLDQGFRAAKHLGILPKETTYRRLKGWAEINEYLGKVPIVQAHKVHDGWGQPDRKSGCINHAPAPTRNSGGHATVMVGMGLDEETGKVFVYGQNSWGEDWGRYGFFCMTTEEWEEGCCLPPLAIILPRGWHKYRGWEKYVI